MRGCHSHQARRGKKKGESFRIARVRQGDTEEGGTVQVTGGRDGKDAAIAGEQAVFQASEGVQGPCPRGPDPEGMEKSAESGKIVQRKWEGGGRVRIPRVGGHYLGQLGVQQLALRPRPMPELLKQRGAVGQQCLEPGM